MTTLKSALVLHLSGGGEPLLIAIAPDSVEELSGRLADLIREAGVVTVEAANGAAVAINFAHVLAAHVDSIPGIGQIYGSPPRGERGF